MSPRRKMQVIDAAIALLALVTVITAVGLAFAVAYPRGVRQIGADLRARYPAFAQVASDVSGGGAGVVDRVRGGWRYRVFEPLGLAASQETTPSGDLEVVAFPAEECAECHPYWQERPLFSIVYFDHPAHEAAEIGCDLCHVASGPRRDTVPAMSGCEECHEDWTADRALCINCHPPGSLFHGADLAGSREIGDACETCHADVAALAEPRRHIMPVLDGSDEDACVDCHAVPDFCSKCHPASHPGGYRSLHVIQMQRAEVYPPECWTCHDARWCGEQCHTGLR